MDKYFYLFVFHGSKNTESDITIKIFEQNLKKKLNNCFSICYLKEKSPTLCEALEQSICKGFKQIKCFPLFVLPGSHINKDIPSIIQDFKSKHTDCSIEQMPCIAQNKYFIKCIIDSLGEKSDGK